jgi:hypothetical protein
VKFVHIRHLPLFFLTITTFANQHGYRTSRMNPASNGLCTSAFTTATFLPDILWSFGFLGLAEGFTYSLCLIISLLTPIISEVYHVKTSLFLSRNESNSAFLLADKSWEIITALSNTLGSKGTLLVSHSGSIGLLMRLPSFLLLTSPLLFSVFSSCRQFTFMWPGAKPCSIVLTSFCIP